MAGVPRGRPNDYRTNCRSERNGTERPRITQAPPTCQAAPHTAVSISLHTLIKHGCLSKDTVYKSFYTRCDKKLGGGVWERGYFSVHALGLLLLLLSHYVPLVRIIEYGSTLYVGMTQKKNGCPIKCVQNLMSELCSGCSQKLL